MRNIVNKILAILKGESSDKKRILIIESRNQALEYINKALNASYELITAQNQIESLNYAKTEKFDLIVLNSKLNKERTLQLCASLRNLEESKHIPILIIAEKGDDAHVTDFYSQRIEGYFMEPFTTKEILNQVQVALNPRK